MILPPAVTLFGAVANTLNKAHAPSVFVDMQASLVNLKMHRYIVEHQVPGREGGILQDLGSATSVITIRGKWIYGNKPEKDILSFIPTLGLFASHLIGWNWIQLQLFQHIYRFKEPLYFASDLITTMVMIEDFDFKYEGGKPSVYDYTMVLREIDPRITLLTTAGSEVWKNFNIIPQESVGL